jgi:hypothetical protein
MTKEDNRIFVEVDKDRTGLYARNNPWFLSIKITLEFLAELFNDSPGNILDDGETLFAAVNPDKYREFGNLVAKLLKEKVNERDDIMQLCAFGLGEVFEEIFEGAYVDVVDYFDCVDGENGEA